MKLVDCSGRSIGRRPPMSRSTFVLLLFLSISMMDPSPLAVRPDGIVAQAVQGSADAYVIEELTTRYQFQDNGSGERVARARILVNDRVCHVSAQAS